MVAIFTIEEPGSIDTTLPLTPSKPGSTALLYFKRLKLFKSGNTDVLEHHHTSNMSYQMPSIIGKLVYPD